MPSHCLQVMYTLEVDKNKVTKAIVGGSTTELVMYLNWNAVVLGSVFGDNSLVDATTIAVAVMPPIQIQSISFMTSQLNPLLYLYWNWQ